jgi:hypothetical protein
MANDPNWNRKTTDQKLEFLKLWADQIQRFVVLRRGSSFCTSEFVWSKRRVG